MENMRLCSNSWPIDYDLLQLAVTRRPQHRPALENLLDRVEDGMCEKYRLDNRIGQALGLDDMAAQEWPTNNTLFLTAIAKRYSAQDYMGINELQDLRSSANKALNAKRNLDASIVQIIEGPFGGDVEKAREAWEAKIQPGYITPPASPRPSEPPPILRMPTVVSDVLAQSGAFDEAEAPAQPGRWTEDDYKLHCLPENAGPYDHLTEEDWEEWEAQQKEAEKNEPWCNYCHRDSGCDGDHGDEMRGGFLLYKGPTISPLTAPSLPQAQAPPQAQLKPTCGPTLKCSWPEFCRCGWQFHPLHEVAQFRGGTAEWDSATERWNWTSASTLYSSTWSMHFPFKTEQEQVLDYIEEVDQWSKDMARIIAESRALREAPLSAFADLAALEDDDTIPDVDIDAI
jgi:hypothetical protein